MRVPRLFKKNTQEVNEHVYAFLGLHWNTLYADCLKNIQELNERIYTIPGMHWNTQYPDCVRNIHIVSEWAWLYSSRYRLKCIAPLFALVPGIFTLAKPSCKPINDQFIVAGICWLSRRWISAGSAIICPTHKPCYVPRRENSFYKSTENLFCGWQQCAHKY